MLFKGKKMKDSELKKFMLPFRYKDQRISHLLNIFDEYVYFIRNYDENFQLDEKKYEPNVLAGYRNSAYGILFALFQLGHLNTGDFHLRLHALNSVFFDKVKV